MGRRALAFALCLALSAPAAWANARITVLMDTLRIDEVVEVMRAEGFDYAQTLNEEMLNNAGGAFWNAQVQKIYDTDRMTELLRQAFEDGLSPEAVDAAITFFNSDAGAQIITLENAARQAMSDEVVEDAARDVYRSLKQTDDTRMRLVERFVAANDLVERNVSGAMNSHIQFYTGLADGRYLARSEDEILRQVWTRQDEIRSDTEEWVFGYLLMAYQPVPLEDLEAYIAYSQTQEGQQLNAALFEGFGLIYRNISYALGRSVALNADGEDI